MGEEVDLKDNERPQHTPNDRIGGGKYLSCRRREILSLRATPGGLFANSQADGFVLEGLKAGRESRMLVGECLDSDKSKRTMLLLYCSSLVSSSSILNSLIAHSSHLKHIHQTHAFMLLRAFDTDNLHLSRFINACSSLGFYSYAYSLFTSITHAPDIYLYNNIIKALSSSPTHPKASIFLYNNIQPASLRPDSYSFPFVLKAVTRFSSIQTGRQLHSQSIRFGLHSNLHVLTAFVQMYASFGSGCISDARKLFDGMSISSGDANRPHDAIALFRRMQLENVEPDEIAMLVALTACARLGALELGEWVRHYIDRLGLLTKNIPLNNALIDMYAKSGDIKSALQVFENLNHKTIITWTTMIAGLALHGLGTEALEMFSRMERARVKPNFITFTAILSACSHVGLVQTGRWYFNRMISRYGIEPKIEHYGCMIDLLGRAGHLKEAQKLLAQMPFKPNAVIWGSLLAACNIHGDPELGELALQHLLELEPDNSGNYALLSNIYASRGRWNESRVVRKFDRIQEVLSKINRQLRLSQHFEKESDALLDLG
ncbi:PENTATRICOPEPTIDE REPEAT-CONTAINING PROTEIN [Salix purpurea]|uniref:PENTATRICOPEPTIDE REPEAT-CONTAINING PROTEIN n=1 Tax=Salix purpurea TaxID=77065 RepID=A0A9Q0QDK6_SALPP|nr:PENTATRICOPEPTIDE REPEAT-CONTAINING PROTEIN [Salix purpurea]